MGDVEISGSLLGIRRRRACKKEEVPCHSLAINRMRADVSGQRSSFWRNRLPPVVRFISRDSSSTGASSGRPGVRRILVLVTALGLAACDADQVSRTLVGEANQGAAALKGTRPSAPVRNPEAAGSPDAIAVVTTKSVPEYAKDLDHCRAVVATAMGPADAMDDVEALKRALKEHPQDKIISPVYVNDDRAIRRRENIKSCLHQIGYVIK